MHIRFLIVTLCLMSLLVPYGVFAAENLTVSGWIPYWRDSEGIQDAKKHSALIDTVYPFAYTVKSDGSIVDQAGLGKKDWISFVKFARGKGIEIIPTVMWSDGENIHTVLSNPTSRAYHIEVIAHMVEKGKYDGVDIDYESKKSETIDSFSAFLRELKVALGSKKILSCTIEARTPPASLYREVPEVISYANDYTEINKACDRIVIMAYDQQRADLLLNRSKNGVPYAPVADVDWVEKVVKLALQSFPKEKIVLGIPTYGRHWAVTVAPEWFKGYQSLGALNVPDMLDVAKTHRVTPTRNKAGEMSFSYLTKSTDPKVAKAVKAMKVPKGTAKGDKIALQALAYANKTGKEVVVNVGWYSDAGAMIDKIKLAEKYKLNGVSFFKIDGEEDQKVWRYLAE